LNKYLLIILALLIIAIFALQSHNTPLVGVGTKNFQSGGISFDYPNNWNISNGTNTGGSIIGSYADNNGLTVKVYKMGTPPGYNLASDIQMDNAGKNYSNFQLISQKNSTVNGNMVYEMDYTMNTNKGAQQRKEVWTQKNNQLYGVIVTAPNGTNVNLGSLVDSIKINNSNASPIYRDWARVDLPEWNQEWIFDSYSLNDVDAARHLSSFYPGENGQMALLGHHTTHSAPFRYIDQLKPGDKIIIKDNLTQKQYTYVVTTNPGSDIRWGVEAENINYQSANPPELWLITCWPPGYKRAAYIDHCQLVSVEPLS